MMIEELLKELTLDEKLGMIHGAGLFRTAGVPRLGIPALKMADGPMGVRHDFVNDAWQTIGLSYDYVTYHPSNTALAATWNTELSQRFGSSLGQETRGRGKDVILAPGINIIRSPFGGRNFEYLSEDPYLIQKLVVPLIKGIQAHDVAACVKHFALNNQETNRLEVEVEVSDQALWELYLPGFHSAIREAGVYSLMGAYNKYQGEYCCQSKKLLNNLLRNQWQYDGVLISDWGGVHQTLEGAESALDLEMNVTSNFDDYYFAKPLKQAILAGEIAEEAVDKKVLNILRLMERLNMLPTQERSSGTYNTIASQETVLEIARESVVLLKNEGNHLPLKAQPGLKILVVGENAEKIHSNGGGSSEIKALFELTPLMGLHMAAGGNVTIDYAKGYQSDPKINVEGNWQEHSTEVDFQMVKTQAQENQAEQQALRQEAVEKAQAADVVIFVGGLNHDFDTEGDDRQELNLPYGQDALISALLAVKPATIISFVGGSAVAMPWLAQAQTVIWSWYAGSRSGQALGEVIFGKVNPSGKLPFSFPKKIEDCGAHSLGEFPGNEVVNYTEGVNVGYRHHDVHQIEPLFSFGHGLSYTTFTSRFVEVTISEGSSLLVSIAVEVENTGQLAGQETIQLYVSQNSRQENYKQLQGFKKVALEAGEKKIVTFELSEKNFGRYQVNQFEVASGVYELLLAHSATNISEIKRIELKQTYSYELN